MTTKARNYAIALLVGVFLGPVVWAFWIADAIRLGANQ